MQIRFKKVPESPLRFGLTLGQYVPVSGFARQVQRLLVRAARKIVGNDLYHSVGDDPARTDGEVELPTFVMPLWAFDHFHVCDPGSEPVLTGDLNNVGLKRTDSIRNFAKAIGAATSSLRTDKVYTFASWGVSQFVDCMNWELVGIIPGLRIDVNKLCGAPPVCVAMYELLDSHDERHLESRKRHYFKVAMWSETKPPAPGAVRACLSRLSPRSGNDSADGRDASAVARREPEVAPRLPSHAACGCLSWLWAPTPQRGR